MGQLSVDNLLGIKYLKREDIDLIFNTADHFKEVLNRPIKKVPSLRDITIANLFFENSTRTKLSFELAEKRLSADVINFSSSSRTLFRLSLIKAGSVSFSKLMAEVIDSAELLKASAPLLRDLARSSNFTEASLIPLSDESKDSLIFEKDSSCSMISENFS